MTHDLRNYQKTGIRSVIEAWDSNKKPMVSVATGGGKTVMISQLLFETLAPNKRALVVAHTTEIVHQIYITLQRRHTRSIGIVMGARNDVDSQIIVATRQSLTSKRLSNILEYGAFQVVVIDEAHHATTDNTYGDIINAILKKNPRSKIVGFTATPNRTDGQGTDEDGKLFDDIVFSWSIKDGIRSGFLVPVKHIPVTVGQYPNQVSVMDCKNWLQLSVQSYEKYIAGRRQTLAFYPSVQMSLQFSRALKRRGFSAAHIDGTTPKDKRHSVITDYKNGKIQIICNMEVLTEGFDAPNTSAIIMARSTQSRSLFTQIIGRGLRPSPNKKDCLLINLTGEFF